MLNNRYKPLNSLSIGGSAIVSDLKCGGETKRRMIDLGLAPGTEIKALHKSPAGDPVAYSVMGAVIALRNDDAAKIITK